ncbi:ABC transporter substrate-binding protein [Sulfuriroseicoccus oceanibius]|uniref:Solute-binding protein family 5 domain-containing protein n=1 Tax=Sulfuriroseicoccus oceanibius TaxID=2707525 RepID=A0A6B3LE21_9BACT|nr:ABC transporter substrate-binding protein [Sulfuriroseicoccus oceanibius]QQL44741.1 hypothetical protein G3M56_012805 [Sulfuriroseicoccus oceanibius]
MWKSLILSASLVCAGGALLSSCAEPEQAVVKQDFGLEDFIPLYNNHIAEHLLQQKVRVEKALTEARETLAKAETDQAKANAASTLDDLERELARIEFRQSLDGYFSIKTPEDLPEGLVWNDGMEEPPIGDPDAKKGGRFNSFIMAYPPTLRRFGAKSNHSFRGYLYDNLEIPLVSMHPTTGQFIPGVAKRWAVSADGRTMFYEIDPDARYTDDTPVKAMDYLRGVYVRISDNVVEPFYSQYYRDQFANLTVYSDHLLSISLPDAKPLLPLYASVSPAPEKFYEEYGPDYKDRYQWRAEPTTGAYHLAEDGLQKGLSVTLTRKKDWWAKDKKHYQYMYNPDELYYKLVRSQSKAFEMFRAGEIDFHALTPPDFWYRKSEMPPVFKGYIERYTFYNQFPRPPYGLHINVRKAPLDNRDVRIGISYATNWQKVIDVIFQGDYARMNHFSEGYGSFSNPNIKARPFSIEKARAHFAKAGYTELGNDGILRKPDGTPLSVSVTYPAVPVISQRLALLKEEAAKAGLELRLNGLDPSVAFKETSDKKHQICFTAWGMQPPFPRYHQFLHSTNAVTEEGKTKPNTNNIFGWADPVTDKLSERIRNASSTEEIRDAAWKVQQIIHDEAMFVPGYLTDFIRFGSWRWMRWPDEESMPLLPPETSVPDESYVFWIDEERKQETLEAMKRGETFPEVQHTVNVFRSWKKPLPRPLPKPAGAELPSDSDQPVIDAEQETADEVPADAVDAEEAAVPTDNQEGVQP